MRKFGFSSTAEEVIDGIDLTGAVWRALLIASHAPGLPGNASARAAPSGQTAVVTGGNSGIGLETCRVLARAGATVVMCARSKELGEAAVKHIR